MAELSEAAKKARREYIREWRKKNPGKVAEYSRRHWEHVAEREADGGDHPGEPVGEKQ